MSCEATQVQPPVAGLARMSFAAHLPARVCLTTEGVEVEPGVCYVVETADGQRLARAPRFELPVLRPCGERPAGTVIRRATPEEESRSEELAAVERDSLRFCREWAGRGGVPMQPVSAVVPLDRNHLLITFAAEQRIDFRELLRDLGRRTRRRVELRQIGVRDQARAQGGWGPCGRALCCSTFMDRFASVTIRMAKAQNLSLNPARISGMCGRLMCCLGHEMPKGAAPPRQRPA